MSTVPTNATPDISTPQPVLGAARVYKRLPGRDLRIYVNVPQDVEPGVQSPALVLFHGGGWANGGPWVMNDYAAHFVPKGFVCFLVEYRLLPDRADTPEICMRDAKSAIRWVRSHANEFGVDPARIAAGGGSAGGHLAATAALMDNFNDPSDDLSVSPKPQALILLNPVLENGPEGFGYKRVGDRYPEFSPFHNVGPGAPPAIILSGSCDHLVSVGMLHRFRSEMQAAGTRCDVHIYEGQIHGFHRKTESEGKYFNLVVAEVENFFHSLGWVQTTSPASQHASSI